MDDQLSNQDNMATPVTTSQPKRRKSTKIVMVVILVLVVVAGLALFMTSNDSDKDLQSIAENTVFAAVSVTEEGFEPTTLEVQKGTSVTWTNNGSAVHQIASDPHPSHDALAGLFSEQALQPTDAFTFTFDEVGTYTYHDHLNPYTMLGTVTVVE